MNNSTQTRLPRRLASLLLAACLCLSLLPVFPTEARADYSDPAMEKLYAWGIIQGYPDGQLHPERQLSRAEFVAMTNRAYGYNKVGPTPFYDVPDNAWFHDDIAIAYNAGYFGGVSPHMCEPSSLLTREQAVVMLARNMRLEPIPGEVTEFSDGRDFADWSRGSVRAAQSIGLISGYDDGSYRPKNYITRGEMAVMLTRALGTLLYQPGVHTLSDNYGNVTINTPNTTLKDSTIAGDLYITGGLDLGDVTLENVRVLGDIIVAGGGESQSGESVVLRNVEAESVKVDSIADQYVSLAAEGNTVIGDLSLRSDAYVQDRTRPGDGFLTIGLESPDPAAHFTLSGNLETVVNKTPYSTLKIAMGTVDTLVVDEEAKNSSLNLDINSTAMHLELDTGTKVTGVGDIADLNVNTAGSNVEMLPDTITIRPGLVADIAGETMNAKEAQESSSDPRLLSGYPRVKNIASKSATGVYAGNKRGTVYWAVSTTTDGSIGEEELIEPTKDNVHILLNGNTVLEAAENEYTSAFEKLTPDSNYYLSTVMVDARGRHSPVKVVSFATPDDTVPAFAKGYPNVLRNYCEPIRKADPNHPGEFIIQRDEQGFPLCNYRVQIAAMPNKNCQLYYALYEKGSAAPKPQEFRVGALGKPIRSGVEDATKNRTNFIELTNLEELKDYDIYLVLIDTDGSRSSAVQKLTFTTVDGKPPRFQYDTPAVTKEALTSLSVKVNVNEDARVYWVASKSEEYIKDNKGEDGTSGWTEEEWWRHACMQIESGSGSLVARSGSTNVRANTDVTINITGLTPATGYYLYFVIKDKAGNYSEFFREDHTYGDPDHPELDVFHNKVPYVYYIHANTLDNTPPTVRQVFTRYDEDDPTRPLADTDIHLVFSEDVMQYTTNRARTQELFESFYKLYKNSVNSELSEEARQLAKDALYKALSSTVKLYNANSATEPVVDRAVEPNNDRWVIDYRNITVDRDSDTGEVTLILHTDANPSKSALKLSSGSTYYFVIDDVADTSSSMNRMSRTRLPNFTTVSAKVVLDAINVTTIQWAEDPSNPVEVPIDMAFSLTPQSTNVESDVDWDLLFFSDYSVTFEVYEIDKDHGTGVPVRRVSNGEIAMIDGKIAPPSNIEIVNNNARINENTKLDDYEGYEGRSLFRDFYKLSFFPSVTGEGHVISETNSSLKSSGIMIAKRPKYYGIHFTAIKDIDEATGRDKIWDATINFRMAVVTGASSNLLTLSRSINKDKLAEAEADLGITQIHSPRPFFLRAQFANTDAPNFATQWPQFEATDTTLTMRVMLDRPGTLYWVVAPASTRVRQSDGTSTTNYTPTIDTNAYINDSSGTRIRFNETITDKTNALYQRYYATIGGGGGELGGGENRLVPLNGSDVTEGVKLPFELSAPSNDQIYAPNYGSERIQSGRKIMGTGMESIIVENMEPDTIYLVYFVTQGTGQVYSKRAQLFQTRTTEISRPYLTMTNSTSSATVTSTNMNATADTGLFLLETIKDMDLFKVPFIDTLDDESKAKFLKDYPDSMIDGTGGRYNQYSVLEALRQRDMKGGRGSMFDVYAGEDIINQIAQLIRAEGSSDRINGQRNLKLTKNDGKELSYRLENRQQYCILTVARAASGEDNASGHSLGFAAAYPIHVRDDALPVITTIGQQMKVNFQADGAEKTTDGFLMGGIVTLTFDRPLYTYEEKTDTRTALTKLNIASFLSSGQNDPRIQIAGIAASDNIAVSTVQITLPEDTFPNDTVINVNPLLAGEYSPARESNPLSIMLHFDPELRKVVAEVSSPKLWMREGINTAINTEVIAPLAKQITITDGPTQLESKQTATLTATLYPTGAIGNVIWRSSDTSIVKVMGSDLTAEVTALDVKVNKTVTITAQLLNPDGSVKAEDTHTITVTPILVKSITLSVSSLEFAPGKPAMQFVTVTISPSDAVDKTIMFNYTDESLISITPVKQSDTVYQLQITRASSNKTGETLVTVSAVDGGGAFANFYVTVKDD
ncbi:MAG: S-layer homology domain-containing protein [Oscillospiraceae bacterium]|nr:S-layer homology domain-containing protein [Oscillospiraceae bacterium]